MKSKLRDLPRFPLRDHGTPERVERIWRRLSPELGTRSFLARPQTWVAPAALVAVFGAGVFVGARFLHSDVTPALSPERPAALEPAAGPPARQAQPAGAPTARPRVAPAHRARGAGSIPPALGASTIKLAPPAPTVLPLSSPPDWARLAENGDFDAARTALNARGGFESVLGTASAAELMSLVDIARASGSREHAVAALKRLVGVFRTAPEAPLAAWTLGNLLDQSGDENGASEAYALYRRLSPGGDFAEDALAREIDAALSQGNLERSARLIAQYENEFPNGRSLEEYRAELARRSERAQAPAAVEGSAPGDLEAAEPARGEAPAGKLREESAAAPKLAPNKP
ncbi:MAG TPA: hypothetical protein VGQ57_04705 [Polyangiaceae bacterium]|nr:hypothetical protein [Polyangiaceae bacterium]